MPEVEGGGVSHSGQLLRKEKAFWMQPMQLENDRDEWIPIEKAFPSYNQPDYDNLKKLYIVE